MIARQSVHFQFAQDEPGHCLECYKPVLRGGLRWAYKGADGVWLGNCENCRNKNLTPAGTGGK